MSPLPPATRTKWSPHFPITPSQPIDYKDTELLRKFITERGKILPRRITGFTSKQQRDLTEAVKRARLMALLPFVNQEA
ncbi:MAG: 30S ribosomal protein S18 [Microcystis panniformis]